MAIALQNKGEHVERLSNSELKKRLYTLISVGGDGDNRAQFRLATAAGMKKELGGFASSFSSDSPPLLIRMTPNNYLSQMLFEGIHFKMMLDGSLHFLDRQEK